MVAQSVAVAASNKRNHTSLANVSAGKVERLRPIDRLFHGSER